jgi:hypothetical protein
VQVELIAGAHLPGEYGGHAATRDVTIGASTSEEGGRGDDGIE